MFGLIYGSTEDFSNFHFIWILEEECYIVASDTDKN